MTLAHKILGQVTVDSEGLGPVDPKPFVAIARNTADAAVSTDGITWTTSTLPASASWPSVAYGDGKYVAVAYSTTVAAYSTDGTTWTTTTLPASSGDWLAVTYGGGKFIAVGATTAASTDGITWTASAFPAGFVSHFVAYGDGKFVAVAYYTTNASISTDGTTWTASTLPASAGWKSVTYGNGKFVAVAYYRGDAAISTDGTTWTTSALPDGENGAAGWTSVAYGDGKFVAVATYAATTAISTDGITWTEGTMPSDDPWTLVAYNGSTFAVVAGITFDSADYSAYSTDGMTWTKANNMPSESQWKAITGGDVDYQAVTYTTPQTIYTVPSSTEAIVSSIFISNTSTTADTYNFAVVPSGETLSDIHYIRKNTAIVAKDFHNIDTKITMSAGDSLVVISGSADKLNINVFGVEKS